MGGFAYWFGCIGKVLCLQPTQQTCLTPKGHVKVFSLAKALLLDVDVCSQPNFLQVSFKTYNYGNFIHNMGIIYADEIETYVQEIRNVILVHMPLVEGVKPILTIYRYLFDIKTFLKSYTDKELFLTVTTYPRGKQHIATSSV